MGIWTTQRNWGLVSTLFEVPLTVGMEGRALVPKSSTTAMDGEDEDDSVLLSLPPPEAQETWYPTLRVTLWVLSCLYTYVDVGFAFM